MSILHYISTGIAGVSASDVSFTDVINDATNNTSGGFLSGTDMPMWALFLIPQAWWFVLPLTLIVACAAVILSLKIIGELWAWKDFLKKCLIRIFVVHCGCFIIASGFLLFWGFVPAFFSEWWDKNIFIYICSNPFGNIFALLFVLAAVALAFFGVYFLDLRFTFKKLFIEEEKLKKLALLTAAFSSPYVFLLPFTLQF